MTELQFSSFFSFRFVFFYFRFVCFYIVSIFCTLIEYVYVCYVHREERNKLKVRKRIKRSLSVASFLSPMDNNMNVNDNKQDGQNVIYQRQNSCGLFATNGSNSNYNNLLLAPTLSTIKTVKCCV